MHIHIICMHTYVWCMHAYLHVCVCFCVHILYTVGTQKEIIHEPALIDQRNQQPVKRMERYHESGLPSFFDDSMPFQLIRNSIELNRRCLK